MISDQILGWQKVIFNQIIMWHTAQRFLISYSLLKEYVSSLRVFNVIKISWPQKKYGPDLDEYSSTSWRKGVAYTIKKSTLLYIMGLQYYLF